LSGALDRIKAAQRILREREGEGFDGAEDEE
jgi:hypothetical protein